jgi:putative heme-binding domain-containing protein
MRWLGIGLVACLPLAAGGGEKPGRGRVLEPLVRVLGASKDVGVQRDILRGMSEGLAGRRSAAMPAGWPAVYRTLAASQDVEVRDLATTLAVLFGDPQALAVLRKLAGDPKADTARRSRAAQTLVEKRARGTVQLLRDLLKEPALRGTALRGLGAFEDSSIPGVILRHYPTLKAEEKADAVAALASRPAFAKALVAAMEKKTVPAADVSPYVVRQMVALGDVKLTQRLGKVWGSIRPAAADRGVLLAKYRKVASAAELKKANRSHGRALFARHCATCHTLFGEGSKIAPDLTGSQRANPEYVLTKVLDPNAVVARDYQMTRVTTRRGRVVTGVIKDETEKTVGVQTPTELVRLPKSDIEAREQTGLSLMPEGILQTLKDQEVRDLLAYLAGSAQVELPGGKK